MALTLDVMRTLVFQFLCTWRQQNRPEEVCGIIGVNRGVVRLAAAQGLRVETAGDCLAGLDCIHLRAAISELEHAGLLAWGRDAETQFDLRSFQLTAFGFKCLLAGSVNVHDAAGYVAALRTRVPAVDAVVVGYVEESLECWRRRCFRASAVMLGCASEKAMLLLIESFYGALQNAKRKEKFEKEALRPLQIQRRTDYFRQQLLMERGTLPAELADALETKLDGIFQLIRGARNASGHPDMHDVTPEDAHGGLLLFPSYCERAFALKEHFDRTPIP
jgi:hypothetical protein